MTFLRKNLLRANPFASSRSSLTCQYKCGNACLGDCDNTSSNPYFGDQFSRRKALRAGGLAVVSVGGGAALAACATGAENENGADSKTGDSASGGKTTASESATDQPLSLIHI